MPTGWFVKEPPTSGVITVALKKAVIAAFGSMATAGSFSLSLKKFSMALSGSALDGSIGMTRPKIFMNFVGNQEIPGSISVSLKKIQSNLLQDTMSGSIAITRPKIAMDFLGGQEIPGSLAVALKKVQVEMSFLIASGVFAPVLKKTVFAFDGGQEIPGTIGVGLKKTVFDLSGVMAPAGTIQMVRPKIGMAFGGSQDIPGTIAISHKKVQVAVAGIHGQDGSIAIGLKKVNFNLISSVPVAFDVTAVGASGSNGFITAAGGSWTHAVTAGLINVALVMVFDVRYGGQTRAGQTTFTVTNGGVQMNLLGFAQVNSENSIEMWGALNVGTGNKSMVLNVGNASNTGRAIIARSYSYANVGSFGTAVTNTGTSTTPSASFATATNNDMVLCGYGSVSQAVTAVTGGNSRSTSIGSPDGFAQMGAGDAVGASPTAFGGTIASSAAWGAVADILVAA